MIKLTYLPCILSLLLSSITSCLHAQAFVAPGGKITDFAQDTYIVDSFPILVENLPAFTSDSFGLSKVCFTIIHPRVSDLKVELQSPDGTSVWLTNRNGGDDASDYYNTCFRNNGFSGYIHQARPPFVGGEFIPDGRLGFINNGQNPNGTWWLRVRDLRRGEVGRLNSFSLFFEKSSGLTREKYPCDEDNPTACSCPNNEEECELLPDFIILESFTSSQIKEYPWDHPHYPGQLRFAATIANIGDGPMETRGSGRWFCGDQQVESSVKCSDGSYPRQALDQRVYFLEDGEMKWKDQAAGFNYYDDKPGHDHFHVDDWVEFRLLKLDFPRGIADTISLGRKVSYCLFDTGVCNNADSLCTWQDVVFGQENLPNYGFGNYASCHADCQGISVGGYDTYGLLYEGQFLNLPKGLPDGEYWLEIEIDPLHLFQEKDRTNNTFRMPVRLSLQ